jgi:hypothetical protein
VAEPRPGSSSFYLPERSIYPGSFSADFNCREQGFASLRSQDNVTSRLREINAPKIIEQTDEKSFDDIAFS